MLSIVTPLAHPLLFCLIAPLALAYFAIKANRRLYHEAGTYVDALSSDEPRVVGAQEGRYIGHVVSGSQPPERMPRNRVGQRRRVGKMLRRHIGGDIAGRHCVNQDL